MKIIGIKQIVLYAIALAALLFLFKWLELRFLIYSHAIELFTFFVACVFTGLGIWLATKLMRPKIETITIEKRIMVPAATQFVFNRKELEDLGISKRELEVLQLMSQGLSNEEIADTLFLSVPTIKSHASKLFTKLEVSRRTQAIEKARKLCFIQ